MRIVIDRACVLYEVNGVPLARHSSREGDDDEKEAMILVQSK